MTTEQMDRVGSRRSNVSVTHTASIQTGSTITMRDIRDLAETNGVPDSATLTFDKYAGDMREPGYTTIKLTWHT
jgi:hypothetical protein